MAFFNNRSHKSTALPLALIAAFFFALVNPAVPAGP
jgi:hypothetical protein